MKAVTRQRLPFIITGALVVLAIGAIILFLLAPSSTPSAAPTPSRAAGSGSEVLPPTATPTTPHLGTDPTSLVTAPLPKTASAKGKLVAGFPTTVISVPTGTKIVSSAIATQGDHMQVTLVGTTAASGGDVQSYFQGIFSALGLTGAVTPSAPGTAATTFSRGADRITVTTSANSGGTRLTVFGLFTAGAG